MTTRIIRVSRRARLAVQPLEGRAMPATITVNSIDDTIDTNDNVVTLREALVSANGNADVNNDLPGQTTGSYGADTIRFDATLF